MSRLKPVATWRCSIAASCAAAGLLMAVVGWLAFGSPRAVPALALGRVVIAEPEVVRLGRLELGSRHWAVVDLVNLIASPIAMVGYRSDCTCASILSGLPLDLPPRSRRQAGAGARCPDPA